MSEYVLTATDFRHHLTWMAELVSYQEYRVVMRRHGRDMVALVSAEDLEFLRKHRPLQKTQRTFFPPEYLAPARDVLRDEGEARAQEVRVVERPRREVVSAEEKARRRQAAADARREERARRKQEEAAKRRAQWRRQHVLNHGPQVQGYEAALEFYNENYDAEDAQLWLIWAWNYFKICGRTEGVRPPKPSG